MWLLMIGRMAEIMILMLNSFKRVGFRGKILVVLLAFSAFCGREAYAQLDNTAPAVFKGLDRWAFKTNVLGWVATLPNFSVEYDLTSSPYNRMTLGIGGRYNWNSSEDFLSYTQFNLFSVTPELRYYWRAKESDGKKALKREKYANYIGVYVSAGSYTLKLSDIGRQGNHYGIGVSYGCAMPLYKYKRGALDVELGFSVGMVMADADAFMLNKEKNVYAGVPEKSKGLHLVKYPVVSELNISFVWRKSSVKHKYIKVDRVAQQEKRMAKEAKRELKNENR